MSSTALFVHVPVDKIEITSGDTSSDELFYFMGLTDPKKSLAMMVNLKTGASKRTFRRKLMITQVHTITHLGGRIEVIAFYGTFAGQPVSGVFNTHTRRGSMSADTN